MFTYVKKIINNARDWLNIPVKKEIDEQFRMIRSLSDLGIQRRLKEKKSHSRAIRVLFICHEPSLWSMFESTYSSMNARADFEPIVVTLPYSHGTLNSGEFRDSGMHDYCIQNNIGAVKGYDTETKEWLAPSDFQPDYVFYQTPYDLFPYAWAVQSLSMISRVCYIPYGACIFSGEVDIIVHPENFYKYCFFLFLDSSFTKNAFSEKFSTKHWFSKEKIIVSGNPKLDHFQNNVEPVNTIWRKGISKSSFRILWTPRWRTEEGTCHFFDYKDFFIKLCELHDNIDFAFRPHPLCLQNLVKTGEFSKNKVAELRATIDGSKNMCIDSNSDYTTTFLTSHVLVTDISSLMLEYMATGNPIIYTHRKNHFNALGAEIAKGCYWVGDEIELHNVLSNLQSDIDPLKEKRKEIIKTVLNLSGEKACETILGALANS
jgi:hypothetical protein